MQVVDASVGTLAAELPTLETRERCNITIWLIEGITHDDKATDFLVFGYQEGVQDTPLDRWALFMSYKIARNWVRRCIITRKSTPLKVYWPSLHLDDKLGITMGLDNTQLARCDDQMVLAPRRSQDERIGLYLEQNRDQPPRSRKQIPEVWCEQNSSEINDKYDLKYIASLIWPDKIREWREIATVRLD